MRDEEGKYCRYTRPACVRRPQTIPPPPPGTSRYGFYETKIKKIRRCISAGAVRSLPEFLVPTPLLILVSLSVSSAPSIQPARSSFECIALSISTGHQQPTNYTKVRNPPLNLSFIDVPRLRIPKSMSHRFIASWSG